MGDNEIHSLLYYHGVSFNWNDIDINELIIFSLLSLKSKTFQEIPIKLSNKLS